MTGKAKKNVREKRAFLISFMCNANISLLFTGLMFVLNGGFYAASAPLFGNILDKVICNLLRQRSLIVFPKNETVCLGWNTLPYTANISVCK